MEAGKDGFKHLWPKQLGEGCLALSQGTVKEVQLCGERGLGGDGCSLDMLNIPCLGESNTYYQNDLRELT